ncbi:hypothetical protein, partial [Haemophilus parainfluenzae]|uniref:hypothetical protein n=1 Tax=Haemophilus parainfluenzae TaxID=729 RepID=UPI00124B4922
GQWRDTPVYRREDVFPSDHLRGPALIIETTSTIVLEPGWSARLTPHNHLILERAAEPVAPEIATSRASAPDPVKLEIFNN